MTILYAYQSRVCELMAESELVTMDSMLKEPVQSISKSAGMHRFN